MKHLCEEIAIEGNVGQAKSILLGRLMVTPGVIDKVTQLDLLDALARHQKRDWGNVCPEDWAANDRAATYGGRILSAYDTASGIRFWIISEANRRVTTALLPMEY